MQVAMNKMNAVAMLFRWSRSGGMDASASARVGGRRLAVGLLAFLCSASFCSAERIYTVGDVQHPWDQSGATPGGVIEFVEDLAQVQAVDGTSVFSTGPSSGASWIVPLRLRPDFNISLGVIDRGGSIDIPNLDRTRKDQGELQGVLDGNHRVALDRKFVEGRVVRNNGIRVRINLGARFGVNRIVFYPRDTAQFPFGDDFLRAYELYVNDGLPQNLFASGQPIFTSPVVREDDNGDAVVDIRIEPQFVTYLELKSITTVGFEIDEIEVYGTGFVPTASYVSHVLDLQEPVVWGSINWKEECAGHASDSATEVRVRSGSDLTPDTYYRVVQLGGGRTELVNTTESGEILTQERYENELRPNERGPVQTDVAHWSQWQPVHSGQVLELPSPRRYFQFSVDFTNHSLDAGRAIDWLSFSYDLPPVDRIVAEIAPPDARIGEVTTFTFLAKVENASARPGFERFQIETPARVQAIRSVEILNGDGQRLSGADFPAATQVLPLRRGDFSIQEIADDHFTLGLPRLRQDGALLKIVFDAAVYRYGTRFAGRAFPAADQGLPLLTEGGDAGPLLSTDALLVRVSLGSGISGPMEVNPDVFSPNGDGINDDVLITYSVYHLLTPAVVDLEIYDLAGLRVRRLETRRSANGRYEVHWDGRADGGDLVPPGLYLVDVSIDSDRTTEHRTAVLGVAY